MRRGEVLTDLLMELRAVAHLRLRSVDGVDTTIFQRKYDHIALDERQFRLRVFVMICCLQELATANSPKGHKSSQIRVVDRRLLFFSCPVPVRSHAAKSSARYPIQCQMTQSAANDPPQLVAGASRQRGDRISRLYFGLSSLALVWVAWSGTSRVCYEASSALRRWAVRRTLLFLSSCPSQQRSYTFRKLL